MSFFEIYLLGFGILLVPLTLLWILSIVIRNVSIIDIFWGTGFIILATVYFLFGEGNEQRQQLILVLVTIWGLRLSIYLGWRNIGKGEDYRYQEFRQRYGPERYWWFSFFQVFLLQGVITLLVSAPLLAGMHFNPEQSPGWIDYLAVAVWALGFFFEAVGDIQLSRFKSKPGNKGKVMDRGLWK